MRAVFYKNAASCCSAQLWDRRALDGPACQLRSEDEMKETAGEG